MKNILLFGTFSFLGCSLVFANDNVKLSSKVEAENSSFNVKKVDILSNNFKKSKVVEITSCSDLGEVAMENAENANPSLTTNQLLAIKAATELVCYNMGMG